MFLAKMDLSPTPLDMKYTSIARNVRDSQFKENVSL